MQNESVLGNITTQKIQSREFRARLFANTSMKVEISSFILAIAIYADTYVPHAQGKWHVGWTTRAYTPTFRGFDTFLGTSGNTGSIFYTPVLMHHVTRQEHRKCVTGL